jgi:GTP-binding protein
LHLVDGTQEDVAAAYRTVRNELEAYGSGLEGKSELVALNKCDALLDEEIKIRRAELAAACGREVLTLSGVSGDGVKDALRQLWAIISAEREDKTEPVAAQAARPWNL